MANAATAVPVKPTLWVPGDWNALFGFGTNILVNVLTLTGLLRYVLKMPDDLVFGRILPATGLMLFLSTVYYAFLAYRLAKKTGRTDVCALPSGISVHLAQRDPCLEAATMQRNQQRSSRLARIIRECEEI